ncbi:Uncharacterized protein DBV15_01232 [Temnothorax longispinosus]|uniref:Uncharacterized protein n=1 Tax=Temnothorax longispinosus TaxID=300112 RepID=A0A4V6RGI6_9HYME|nr:Uncharacterized protein DBV15_01232 [Temnothorax longispinosus]
MGSGDHARARGIEGQVMREGEKGWWVGSELVQHCTKRLMMHLGILVEPIEGRRVLAEHTFHKSYTAEYFFGGTVSLVKPPEGIRKFLSLSQPFRGHRGCFSAEVGTCAASFRFSSRTLVHASLENKNLLVYVKLKTILFNYTKRMSTNGVVTIDLIFLAKFRPAKTCIYDTLSLRNSAGVFHKINIDGCESQQREDAGEPTLPDCEGFLLRIGYGPMRIFGREYN